MMLAHFVVTFLCLMQSCAVKVRLVHSSGMFTMSTTCSLPCPLPHLLPASSHGAALHCLMNVAQHLLLWYVPTNNLHNMAPANKPRRQLIQICYCMQAQDSIPTNSFGCCLPPSYFFSTCHAQPEIAAHLTCSRHGVW